MRYRCGNSSKHNTFIVLHQGVVINNKGELQGWGAVEDYVPELRELAIKKLDPIIICYSYGTLAEAVAGDGAIAEDSLLAVAGDGAIAEDSLLNEYKDIFVGTKIKYIIIKTKPNLALSPEEFEKGEGTFITKVKKKGEIKYEFSGEYDAEYYWLRILKPLLKVLHTYYKHIPKWSFGLTDSQMHKLINTEEDSDEE